MKTASEGQVEKEEFIFTTLQRKTSWTKAHTGKEYKTD